ncbi:MAG: hypothetical protein ACK5HS_02470, partial [Mycoplasmatales bacterium]
MTTGIKMDEIFEKNSDKNNYSTSLFSQDISVQNKEFPILEYIGTLSSTYMLFQGNNGLYLLDQHAAKERVNYELFLNKFKNKYYVYQQTLIPQVIELTQDEALVFNNKHKNLEELGIILEEFGISTYKVVEIDFTLSKLDNVDLHIKDIIDMCIKDKNITLSQYYNDIAISMACKRSIKANQSTNKADALDLL